MNWFEFTLFVGLLILCFLGIGLLLKEVFYICFDTDRILIGIVAIYLIVSGIWGICALIF